MQNQVNTIAIAADHAGYELKQALLAFLKERGFAVLDLGTESMESVDYPDYGYRLGRAVQGGDAEMGIAVCGTGIGISMAANRFHNVRAALCRDEDDARMARRHNNANILALGARRTDIETAQKLVEIFLDTPFEGGRHEKRIEKLGRACDE